VFRLAEIALILAACLHESALMVTRLTRKIAETDSIDLRTSRVRRATHLPWRGASLLAAATRQG